MQNTIVGLHADMLVDLHANTLIGLHAEHGCWAACRYACWAAAAQCVNSMWSVSDYANTKNTTMQLSSIKAATKQLGLQDIRSQSHCSAALARVMCSVFDDMCSHHKCVSSPCM